METHDFDTGIEATMPTFFVDKWMVLAIVFLLTSQPQLSSLVLPPELDNPNNTAASSVSAEPLRVAILTDGTVVNAKQEPIDTEELISALRTDKTGQHVELSIQTRKDGSGATVSLLQFQASFLNAQLADRLHILHTKRKN